MKNQSGTEPKMVKLPESKNQTIIFNIKGITPLIVHKFSEKARKRIEEKKMGEGKRGRDICDPNAEYLAALHVCKDGTPGFPASGFKAAMVRASKNLGHKMTDSNTSFYIVADDKENQLIKINGTHEMRTDPVIVGIGGADIRYRPMFREWSAKIKIIYDAGCVSAEQLATMLEKAGQFVGIGEWRNSSKKSGSFGAFEIQ